MDLISIIVPVYKTEEYLPKCIESLINQTYTNLEIILVDDGSPDNSGQICDEYAKKDGRIVVIHKENGGVSSARNAGLDIAKGNYLTFIDSDDYIESNMCEVLYKNITDNNAEMIICCTKEIYSTGIKVYKKTNKRIYTAVEMGCELFRTEYFHPGILGKLFKTDSIKNVRMNEKIFIGEDVFFMYEAIQNMNRICYIPVELYNYVIRDDSAFHGRLTHKFFTEQTSLKMMLKIAENNMPQSIPYIKSHIVDTNLGMAYKIWTDKERSKKMKNGYLKVFQKNVRKNFNLFDMIRLRGFKRGIKRSILAVILSLSTSLFKAVMKVYHSVV